MGRKMNFRSKEAYRKWLVFDKLHVNPGPSRHPVQVSVRGKPHRVCHTCGSLAKHSHSGRDCCGGTVCCMSHRVQDFVRG